MHLATIVAFICLFWRQEVGADWQVALGPTWIASAALGQPVVIALLAHFLFRRARRIFRTDRERSQRAHEAFHRSTLVLRGVVVAAFGATVLGTHVPDWFRLGSVHPALLVLSDLVMLSLFAVNTITVWIVGYRVEAELRGFVSPKSDDDSGSRALGARAASLESGSVWPLRSYLDFHVRHQFLVVAAPMFLILVASHVIRFLEPDIIARLGTAWAPDVLLGTVATVVFVIAPAMLRRIWRTHPLEAGPVRDRLEALCKRIGLRCRDILVWNSGGMMINAAVMGVVGPLRYVLLSDALLAQMTPRQVEAVFGHEAGHVRHRHMEHFLVFAFVGWLVVAGGMELLVRLVGDGPSDGRTFALTVQGAGAAATLLFWGVGFGWVSRRFERQADLHGARCVTPEAAECRTSCAVHLDAETVRDEPGRVCSTAAAIFASALDRVAMLNGIPTEEKSWRHSSIGSRIRFLSSLAGDPSLTLRFERTLRRIQGAIWIVAVLGAVFGTWYASTLPAIAPREKLNSNVRAPGASAWSGGATRN